VRKLNDFLVSAAGATVLSALVLVSGVLGSLTSIELSTIFSAIAPSPAGRLVVFGGTFALTILGFLLRQREIDTRREEAQSGLERAQRELERLPDLIRTMPPDQFLQDLGILAEKCVLASDSSQEDGAEDDLLESVQATIRAIASLAEVFDDARTGAKRYAANVMVFLAGDACLPWKGKVAFLGPRGSLEGLRGILALVPELTAVSSCEGPDPNLTALALPVPIEKGIPKEGGGDGWEVLPGAPMAFVDKSFQYFAQAREVAGWTERFGNFPGSVVGEIRSYFLRHPEISGLISVPLFAPHNEYRDRSGRDVIGVLSVHWADARRLSLQGGAEMFAESIYPLRFLLSRQVQHLIKKLGAPVPDLVP